MRKKYVFPWNYIINVNNCWFLVCCLRSNVVIVIIHENESSLGAVHLVVGDCGSLGAAGTRLTLEDEPVQEDGSHHGHHNHGNDTYHDGGARVLVHRFQMRDFHADELISRNVPDVHSSEISWCSTSNTKKHDFALLDAT